MPGPKLPRELVLRWLAEGSTQTEIVDRLAGMGIDATQSGVSMLKMRHANGEKEALMRTRVRAELLPWQLRPELRQLHAAKMLRAKSRLDRGEEVGRIQRRQLDTWVAGLNADDACIHYDPDTEQGFWRVPRRPGIDGLIRDPSVP
jgi:hypothetical protein